MGRFVTLLITPLLLISLFIGCAKRQAAVAPQPMGNESTITIKASNYDFEPNNIVVKRGDSVQFIIQNSVDKVHNFTVKDPSGKVLVSLELPSKGTEQTKIAFSEPGIYKMFCNKPFHPSLGVKGQIEVK